MTEREPTGEELEAEIALLRARVEELERDEQTRRQSEKGFWAMFENTKDAVILHGFDGRIFDANEAAAELLRCDIQELRGSSLQRFRPPDIAQDNSALRSAVELRTRRFHDRMRRADGSIVNVEIGASVIDPDREVILGMVREIARRPTGEHEPVKR